MEEQKKIVDRFQIDQGQVGIETLGAGNINKSFLVTVTGKNGDQKRFVLQGINKFVFKDPRVVMSNLEKIYHHFEKQEEEGIKLAELILTQNHRAYYTDPDENVWRLFGFVEENQPPVPENFLQLSQIAGKAYGRFLAILSSLEPGSIEETIPDFHNTQKRFQEFRSVCSSDPMGRVSQLQSEIDFLLSKEHLLDPLYKLTSKELIPIRVTHNDPKMDNVLIHPRSKVCTMIDLDTVMPGYLMYDFGDMVRTFCTTAKSEDDLDKVELRMEQSVCLSFVDDY